MKQAFGDNIYYKDHDNEWHQLDSHHSYQGGIPNLHNIQNDTQSDNVLIGTQYAYWGGSGQKIATKFRNYDGDDICAGRNHRSIFPPGLVEDFVAWFLNLDAQGYLGDPMDWSKTQ